MISLLKKKFMVILILVVIIINFTTSINIVLATDTGTDAGTDTGTDTGTDAGTDTGTDAPEQIFNEEEAKEAEEGIWGEEGESLNGGVLYKSFVKFTTGIGDIFIKFLQKSFLGENFGDILYGTNYQILYSPATIFSGKIPAFDINFFDPTNKSIEIYVDKENVTSDVVETIEHSSTDILVESMNDVYDYYINRNKDLNSIEDETLMKEINMLLVYKILKGGYTQSGTYISPNEMLATNMSISTEVQKCLDNIHNDYSNKIENKSSQNLQNQINELRNVLDVKVIDNQNSTDSKGNTVYSYYQYEITTNKEKNSTLLITIQNLEISYLKSSTSSATPSVNFTYQGDIEDETNSQMLNKVSVASILQKPVSKWYTATRTIALVGLLSGIVYIGIRIITSSTGKEQAKYKQWIMNWVAAICLLFILHYLMAGIIKITQEISEIFIAEIAGDENTIEADEFMTGIRTTLGDEPAKYSNFPELVIYIALVIYTLIFTFHYLKRVVYMAFLTMVAPLIALTYPIDKIKDSKSQAFDMWLKEYIYNALLQVMHLILYFVFIHSATELVDQNPIYAIITIGFFVPAEKFIKKMFGFNNQESMGEFEAAAGGALTMNAINEVSKFANSKGSAPEGTSNKSEGNQQPQGGTNINFSNSGGAWNNGMPPAGGGTGGSDSDSDDNGGVPPTGTPPTGTPPTGTPPTGMPQNGNDTEEDNSIMPSDFSNGSNPNSGGSNPNSGGSNPNSGGSNNGAFTSRSMPIGGGTPINTKGHRKPRTIEGVKNLAKKKHFGRKVLKGMFKIPLATIGALTMGTIGLAAGVATGDPSKAFTFASAGLMAGKKVGGAVVDKAIGVGSSIKKDVETFRQGYEGTEYDDNERERQNAKFLKDGEAIQKYRANFEDYEEAMRLAIRFRNEGITDDDKIISAIKIGESERQSVETMINATQHEAIISNSAYQKKSSREEYRNRMKSGIHRNLQLRNNPRNDTEISKKNMDIAEDNSIQMMRLIGRLKNYDF